MKNLKLVVALILFIPQLSWAGEATKVKAVPFSELAFYLEYSAPATVESLNESTLSAELSARITHLNAKVGEQFKKGTALVRLDCGDYKLALQQAQAGLTGVKARHDFAQQRLIRAERLQSQQNISEELLEQNQMELAGLESELSVQKTGINIAERNISKCTVRAPFDAIVLDRLSGVGALANPGTPLIKVIDAGQKSLEVTAQVMAQQVELLQQASQLEFRSNDHVYPVKLRIVVGVVEPLQRSRDARLIFVEKRPLPGQSGRLIWKDSQAVIPADFLMERGGSLGMFVAENGIAKFYKIPDALEGRPLRIDLPQNAWVITEGRYGLNDGDRINRVR
ncbi:MAG: efflux RND transporter periplasmic adaptor subunit [Gammaproteobacteria bacterium]|nr:efflux RND transporter periplasmic adaptor subunit [Gammaproteobacteria bacterium]